MRSSLQRNRGVLRSSGKSISHRLVDVFGRVALTLAAMLGAGHAFAQTAGSYQITPILSDGYATAPLIDKGFVDPWGFNNVGTFWINTNVTGFSYVTGANGMVRLRAIVPPATGTGPGKPTGVVKNVISSNFLLSNGSAAIFLFGTLDGTISGWNGSLGGTLPSLVMIDNSAKQAVYTDIALDPSANGTVLLATNFGAGAAVEAYTTKFTPTTLAGNFTDPNIPAGYAPYAVHVISGQVYVTYMLRSTAPGAGGYGSAGSPAYSETLGPNTGFVSVFDLNGNFLKRAITGGNLNAPWGVALAPASFGVYGGDLLVGNLGDGLINVYDPNTFAYLGQLDDATGNPVLFSLPGAGVANSYVGLWEIGFGQGNSLTGTPAIASSGDPSQLYFAAGLDAEQHGLFGSISNVPPTGGTTSFAFSASTPELTVKAGQTTSATLSLAPINGFNGAATLTCSGLPVSTSCSFSPASVTLAGSAPVTTVMTISTNVATARVAVANHTGVADAGLLLLPAALLLFGIRRRKASTALRVFVFLVVAGASAAIITGCTSGTYMTKSPAITPAGTSKLVVTANSGTMSRSTSLAVTVQ